MIAHPLHGRTPARAHKNLASAATAQFLIFTTALFLVVAAVGQQASPGNSVTSNTQNANTGNGVSGNPNCNCVDLLVSYQISTSSNNPYGFAVGGTNYGKYSIGWTNVAANPSSAVRSLGSYCQTTTYDPQTGIFSTNVQSSGYFTSIYGTIYTQSNSPTSYSTYSGYSFSTNTPLYSTSTNYQTITTTNTLVTNDCAGDTTNVTTSMTNNSTSPSPGSVMQVTPLPISTGYGPGNDAYMNSSGGWTYSDPLPPPPTNTVAQARAQANASLGPWGPYNYTQSNTGTGSYTTSTNGVSITNGKYYWHAHGTQPVTVNWFLLYTSQDGSTTSIIKTNSWTSTGPGDSPKYSDLTVPPSRGAGTVTLLPVQITLQPQGASSPPTTGVLVTKGATIQMALNPGLLNGTIPQTSYPLQTSQVNWQYREMNGDGTFTSWTNFQATPEGPEFNYTTTLGGIYQVQAIITVNGNSETWQYVRQQDDPNGSDSDGNFNPIYAKGQPDYFGVVDSQWQIDVRNKARTLLGSTAYSSTVTFPPLYSGGPTLPLGDKCNIFVYMMCNAAGDAPVSLIRSWKGANMPPLTLDWYDGPAPWFVFHGTPASPIAIPGWASLGQPTWPEPGYVVSRPAYTAGEITGGHAGILDYDGAWINAGSGDEDNPGTVNRYPNITPPGNSYNNPEHCSYHTP